MPRFRGCSASGFHRFVQRHAELLIQSSPARFVALENLPCPFGHFLSVFTRNHNHAVAIRSNHIALPYQYSTTHHGLIDRLNFVSPWSYSTSDLLQVEGNLLLDELIRVAGATAGYDAAGSLAFPC